VGPASIQGDWTPRPRPAAIGHDQRYPKDRHRAAGEGPRHGADQPCARAHCGPPRHDHRPRREGMINLDGSALRTKEVLANPNRTFPRRADRGLDNQTAFEIRLHRHRPRFVARIWAPASHRCRSRTPGVAPLCEQRAREAGRYRATKNAPKWPKPGQLVEAEAPRPPGPMRTRSSRENLFDCLVSLAAAPTRPIVFRSYHNVCRTSRRALAAPILPRINGPPQIFRRRVIAITPDEGSSPSLLTWANGTQRRSEPHRKFSIAKYEVPQNLWEAVMGQSQPAGKGSGTPSKCSPTQKPATSAAKQPS